MLKHLKASNPALEKTMVFIVDKDFAGNQRNQGCLP